MQYTVSFPTGEVQYLFNSSFAIIGELVDKEHCVIITDSNVFALYQDLFKSFKTVISIPAGETSKQLSTITYITDQLLQHEVHRKSFLLGIGGGVITDITGFVASVYMRGIPFGFVPTSLLAMVDASVGGKNGINYKQQKNLIGSIQQPKFLLYDASFLDSLPDEEWSNGFAEVIKYGLLFDKKLFDNLSNNNINYYQKDKAALSSIIAQCVDWKNKIVQADEQEKGTRKLLNFGHTVGHAIETTYQIPHGQAVAIGMVVASHLSEDGSNLKDCTLTVADTLRKYNLATTYQIDIENVLAAMKMDKKRNGDHIDFILLEKIGKAYIKPVSLTTIKKGLEQIAKTS